MYSLRLFFFSMLTETIDPLLSLDPQNTELRPPRGNGARIPAEFCVTHIPMVFLLHCLSTHTLWPLEIYLLDSAEIKRSLEKGALQHYL